MSKKAGASKPKRRQRTRFLPIGRRPTRLPPFDKIKIEHFLPVFDAAFEENIAEIEAIAAAKDKPTFANTIEALERAGKVSIASRASSTISPAPIRTPR